MEFFVFIFSMAIGAACFMAGYFAHGRMVKITKQVQQLQESVKHPPVPSAPRPIYNVTIDHAAPRWSTRVQDDMEETSHFDVTGSVSSGDRKISIHKGSTIPGYGMFSNPYISIPASNVDDMILAMKSAQLAAMSGPEE